MTRFKLTIEYDGASFQGWQRLPHHASVQGALEDAVVKLTGAHADVIGAGRTDAGVHARGQVAHIDIDKPFTPQRLADGLNAHLRPHPISVLEAKEAAPEFHARFDAVKRAYMYRIINRRAPLALERGKAWRVSRALDVEAMKEAASRLVGHHDFTTFRDTHCQAKSPIKTLDRCDVVATERSPCHRDDNPEHNFHPHPWPLPPLGGGEAGTDEVYIICEARSFLHRQVRSMVGTLVEVGLGKISADDVAAALAAKDRARCGPVAPAEGLYLMRVDY